MTAGGVIPEDDVRALPACPTCGSPPATRCVMKFYGADLVLGGVHVQRRAMLEQEQQQQQERGNRT